ncbi:MAG: glycosyltransferase [Candidatus Aenigmatarchaeota archaeon]
MIELLSLIVFSALIVFYLMLVGVLVFPKKVKHNYSFFPKLSILIPAHNEEKMIEKCVKSISEANYLNEIEIIVLNNGSTDDTEKVVRKLMKTIPNLKLLNLNHIGKASALNKGIKVAKNDVIVTVDADSIIEKNALLELVQPLAQENVGGVTGVIRAIRNKNPLTWFQDFEYVLSSGWRYVCTKMNGNIILPGFAAFKKQAILKAGGFSKDTLTEDYDIALSLKKAGYQTITILSALLYTEVPQNLGGIIKQRIRWTRGTFQVIKKHLNFIISKRSESIKFFSIPTQVFWYVYSLLYLPVTFYTMFGGYFQYFLSHGIIVSSSVIKYFFSWFSLYGMAEMIYKLLLGYLSINLMNALIVFAFTLSLIYNMSLWARLSLKIEDVLIYFFYFPYALLILSVLGSSFLYELLTRRPKAYNLWTE